LAWVFSEPLDDVARLPKIEVDGFEALNPLVTGVFPKLNVEDGAIPVLLAVPLPA
jgi:hypothetical protein